MISGHCARRENHRARPRLVSQTIHKISHRARVSTSVRLSHSIASRSAPPPSRSVVSPSSLASSFTRTVTDAFTARIFAYSSAFVTTPPAPCGTACVHAVRVRQSIRSLVIISFIHASIASIRRSTHRERARELRRRSRSVRASSRASSRDRRRGAHRVSTASRVMRSSFHMGAFCPRDAPGRGTPTRGRRRGRDGRRERGARGTRRKRWWCYDECGRGGPVREVRSRGVNAGAARISPETARRASRRRRRARGLGARIRRRGR